MILEELDLIARPHPPQRAHLRRQGDLALAR
jgi:hypothetical protein